MPREKKQKLKKRKDGRYACRYKDQWFYSHDPDDALAQREEYKRLEKDFSGTIPIVQDYAEKWLLRAYPDISPSTLTGLKIHLKKLIKAIGHFPLDLVRPSDIKEIYSTQYLGLSKSYIDGAKQLYCSLFDAAQADGFIHSNPARDKTAKPHKGTVGRHRQITQQEREWICTLCTDHRAHPAVMAMLYAGIRPQEMKSLKIDRDVDFEKELITLREFVHLDGTRYTHTKVGKTEKAARTIPLFPPLKDALKGKTGYLITSAAGERVDTIQTWESAWESYVSCMETAINGISRRWYGKTRQQKILAQEGKLPPWISFTVVPYDLRHSFCCWCRDADPPVEINTVIRWMGHTDEKMVLRIYDEASDDRSQKEAERLKKTFFRSQNGSQDSEP